MSKTATIIPIHPPRFVCGEGVVRSWEKFCTSDLYFVFSNLEDAGNFANTVSGNYKTLVLPEDLREYRNPITVKKFYGVSEVIDRYDYVGVFDAEMRVVRPFDTDAIYSEVWNRRELKCNQCWPDVSGGAVVHNNSVPMGWNTNENLLRETENFKWYWWFNEICVYEKETFKEFFGFLNCSPYLETIYNEYWCFDYLIYGMWLICFEGFKCKKYFPDRQFGFGAIEHNQFNIGGVTEAFNSYMDSNMYPEKHENIKVQFHYDRYIPESDKHKFRV